MFKALLPLKFIRNFKIGHIGRELDTEIKCSAKSPTLPLLRTLVQPFGRHKIWSIFFNYVHMICLVCGSSCLKLYISLQYYLNAGWGIGFSCQGQSVLQASYSLGGRGFGGIPSEWYQACKTTAECYRHRLFFLVC